MARGLGESKLEYERRMDREESARLRRAERRAWREGARYGYSYGTGETRELPAFVADRNPYGPEFAGTKP